MSRTSLNDLKVAGSFVRCPFCHDTIEVEAKRWLACADCMARHHDDCWSEGAGCGNCGGAEALTRAKPTFAPAPRRSVPSRRLPLLQRTESPTPHHRLQNGPAALFLDAEFEGELLLPTDVGWFERAMRKVQERPGSAQLTGRLLQWKPDPPEHPNTTNDGAVRASLRVTDGRTRLRVHERYDDLYTGAYTLGVALAGGVLGLGLATQLGRDDAFLLFPLIAVGMLIAFLGVRSWLVPCLLAHRRTRLVEIADRLVAQLEQRDSPPAKP